MNAPWLTGVVAFAAVASINALAALLAWSLWPAVRARAARVSPSVRARVCFAWSTMPALAAATAGASVALAFAAFEPFHAGESAGLTLVSVAVAGAGMLLATVIRFACAGVASVRLSRGWHAGGSPLSVPGFAAPLRVIDTEFPVAALVGFRRPQFVLARAVAERCSPCELAAIVAHEQGHEVAGDNVRRLVLRSLTDVLSWTRRGAEMRALWREAAEQAADDYACRVGAPALDLASALIAVSRLAVTRPASAWADGMLFYRGCSTEHRVRRLIDGTAAPGARGFALSELAPSLGRWIQVCGTAALVVAVVALTTAAPGRTVHAAAEWFVQRLP